MSQAVIIPSKQQVADALAELGASSDAVAISLYRKGIKGVPKKPEVCPIAKHLEKKFPGAWFSVKGASIDVGINLPGQYNTANTVAGTSFVSSFDNGGYGFVADVYVG